MRYLLIALLLTAGCTLPQTGEPAPPLTQMLHQESSLEGSGTIGSVLVSGFPVTYPVQWSGRGKLTIQYPAKPHVIASGDLVVAPIPPYVAQTHQAVAQGRMAFLRGGLPAAMVAPGTIPTKENP